MARIRTIKPEFPQSESMGRVSRDARLCYILLWTLADDAGRLRGNSRMLASLLYPYDDDAKKLADKWLTELADEHCITRYEIDGNQYIQIGEWLTHQKIDKPSPSKIPAPKEDSRGFAKDREDSTADQGVEGNGEEGNTSMSPAGDGDRFAVPPCPYQSIIDAYADKLPQLSQVAVLSDPRKRTINARWREVCASEKFTQAQGIEYFADYFGHCAKSPFLVGNGSPDKSGRVWKADFDWLMSPQNFIKVIEGKYHQSRAA